MKTIRVAAAALNQTPLDWSWNLQNILGAILEAKEKGVDILCLPELCITGYGCEDQFFSPDVQNRALQTLEAIVDYSWGITVTVGLPIRYQNALYNCIAMVSNHKTLGIVAKQHLAGDGVHYEPRWFKPWPSGVVKRWGLPVNTPDVPIGDVQFQIGGVNVGFEICEDAWVADRPGVQLAKRGVDIILNPSASHFAFGKHEIRKRFVLEGSRAFGATYVYANLLGNEAGRIIYDGGTLIASEGKLLAEGPRLTFKERELTCAVVDIDLTRTRQSQTASFAPDLESAPPVTVRHVFNDKGAPTSEIRPAPPMADVDEFTGALTLGLYDYLRKSGTQGFVVSLSGGADSAACSVLARLMVRRAISDLGTEEFCRKTRQSPHAKEEEIVKKLLTCIYQATENSSEATAWAAETLADEIGGRFLKLDVDPIVKAYTEIAEKALGRELTWETDDIALQNVQARVRAPSAWLIANLENKLLLATSNRSEAAVGYCTMDGDTAGAISPLGGIDKAFLLRWLRHVSDQITALKQVLALKPTAELRPMGQHQTDETDLMPYEILEFIEDAAIRDKRSPKEVARLITEQFQEHAGQAIAYTTKFFRLWSRNQWKRERYALGIHVDDKNLDPRSWCRFPVLSGGFSEALEELHEHEKSQTSAGGDNP